MRARLCRFTASAVVTRTLGFFPIESQRCAGRNGDDPGIEVAQLQAVMHRIQSMLLDVPQAQREYIANALLNLAVSRMVSEEGSSQAASILLRLGDVVATGDQPPPQRAIDLTRMDS